MKSVNTVLYFLLALLVSAGHPCWAQCRITGTVTDTRGLPIGMASIWIKGSFDGTSSDSSGYFAFETALTGEQWLRFSALGHGSDSTAIMLAGDSMILELRLTAQTAELDVVTITVGTFQSGVNTKGISLSALDVATTAGAFADIFAAYQTLPGSQTAFAEGGLFVRGGSAAETKSFFDGLIIKNPLNAQAPNLAGRSRLDPFMFKQTAFSSGGYSAQYGQALSSALVLESKDLPAKTTSAVSLMSVGIGLGHTHRFKTSALQIDGFYYNLAPAFSLINQQVNWQREPEQYEGRLQYKAQVGERGLFKWYSDHSRSRMALLDADMDNPGQPFFFSNRNRNTLINTSYQNYLNDGWKIHTGASLNITGDDGQQNTDGYNRTDSYLQWRGSATHFFGTYSRFVVGGEVAHGRFGESWNDLRRQYAHLLGALFAEADWFFGRRWVLRTGIRTEYSDYIRQFNVAPRLALSHKISRTLQASLAYGRFYQNPEDRYWVAQQDIGFEQAAHYLANIEYLNNHYTFRIEAYYKDYGQLVKKTAEGFNNNGYGYAKGIDIFWRDRKSIRDGDYWISYSYLDTKRDFADYPAAATPPFAAAHSLNAVYKHFITAINSQVGATYTYASGRTYVNPNNPVYLADRTKDFHNLSVNVSYLTHILRQFTVLYFSAGNLLGIDNIYGYRYSKDGIHRRAIRPGARRDLFVGILLTIGDNTFIR
ncbi:TonB-dependent receptor [Parapedobacter sp. ISTM3]|uniref:TonB-dependent receptor n=1 Tax=Parapedobacter sp. ISTM3 TaxID=2800130 RepID=UPI0019075560|nr:TonB-dependent receptor [Parapedobacter sp. ISTM3]MBK1442055.1 TonB-dependent receptor [Parapedobacter sp. ISTM3]